MTRQVFRTRKWRRSGAASDQIRHTVEPSDSTTDQSLTPLLIDLSVCLVHGLPFCGHATAQRPVAYIDLESKGKQFRRNIVQSASRRGVQPPVVPDQMAIYLEGDKAGKFGTQDLRNVLAKTFQDKVGFLKTILSRKPNALIIIDPLERFFSIDTNKKQPVMSLYCSFRSLLALYPHATILMTFNLRKKDRRDGRRPDLLHNPQTWLEEICGSLDLMNRSDVRLGMDFYGDEDEARVVNGIRRGEEMDPLLIRPVGDPVAGLAGFEICPPSGLDLLSALTYQQRKYWDALPKEFRFDDIAEKKIVPRSSLSRLLRRAKSLALIREDVGTWRKGEP